MRHHVSHADSEGGDPGGRPAEGHQVPPAVPGPAEAALPGGGQAGRRPSHRGAVKGARHRRGAHHGILPGGRDGGIGRGHDQAVQNTNQVGYALLFSF